MAKIVWSEPALEDLDRIADYIALQDLAAAQRLVATVVERVAMLGMPANNDCYAQDVVRAAKSLHQAMLEVVTEKRVKAVRK